MADQIEANALQELTLENHQTLSEMRECFEMLSCV
jgi:hypothetical protein